MSQLVGRISTRIVPVTQLGKLLSWSRQQGRHGAVHVFVLNLLTRWLASRMELQRRIGSGGLSSIE